MALFGFHGQVLNKKSEKALKKKQRAFLKKLKAFLEKQRAFFYGGSLGGE
jgi:hypothetical protein